MKAKEEMAWLAREDLPIIPKVRLGRTGIESTRLGLGCAVWPNKLRYELVVENLQVAFALGIRHIDVAPLYQTEGILGRALKDADAPDDMVLSTKSCAYLDDIGIMYREYSGTTVYKSVERSMKLLQVDQLDIVHLHDVETPDLEQIFADGGALAALLDLKEQGVVRSIGFATYSLQALRAAVDSGAVDHIQAYHTYTLLNQDLKREVLPVAKANNLAILNNAPYAGYILLSGAVENARYNYRVAERPVLSAVSCLESICADKGVNLATAALAFSLLDPDIDVTVVGASSPAKLVERVKAFDARLSRSDFDELVRAAGGPHAIESPYRGNNPFMDDRGL
jgi:aryl-alcohol dehydrogenase-like predicted oxidoreductase